MRLLFLYGLAAHLATGTSAQPATGQPVVLDDFDRAGVAPWEVVTADGVSLTLSQDAGRTGRALRMDVDFGGNAGYAIARRPVSLRLAENYRLRFWARAEAAGGGPAPVNDLEFKLVDPSGENVWWHNRRRFTYPAQWTALTSRPRHVEFAWGPRRAAQPDSVATIEIVVTADQGGASTLWIDDFTAEALAPEAPYARTPTAATTSGDASAALDGRPETAWNAAPGASLTLDWGEEREFGGLALDWLPADRLDYTVELSSDGRAFAPVWTVDGGRGGPNVVPLPEASARFVRLRTGSAASLAGVQVLPLAATATWSATFETIAARAPRGHFPEMFSERQTYWTVTGVDGDAHEALVSETGAVEVRKAAFSVEPFLYDGRLISWADADTTTVALQDGYLPIPSVTRRHGALALTVTAVPEPAPEQAGGVPGSARLVLRYRVDNTGQTDRSVRLLLAVRPFQVNPPSQWLNTPGGAGRIARLAVRPGGLDVDDWAVQTVTPPDAAGVTAFSQGDVSESLAAGTVPPGTEVLDPLGFASGVLAYDLIVPAGGSREVALVAPFGPATAEDPLALTPADVDAVQDASAEAWRETLDRVRFTGPADVQDIGRTLRSQLAYVLVNRDGAGIQPGSRAYERSWIRDGALTSSALLRMGVDEPAVAFARWYAPFQYDSGKVPCCVDYRGAEPTPENDSHGQLIFLAAEVHRFTGDRAFLREMWPHVRAAVGYMETIRAERMTPAYRADTLQAYFGLLPESISHEGYSARPMHSYWDQLFALRGYSDAGYVADQLGETAEATRLRGLHAAFAADLGASYRLAMAKEGIDFLPGSVELGDFDPTSVSVALDPVGAGDVLPPGALERTYARYWEFFEARRDTDVWRDYTPYEWRNVSALVRLGEREQALAVSRWLLGHRRPAGWNAFAEVVGREARVRRFVGDIPHTWVGSDFVRAALDLFAFEDEAAERIVVGAGLDPAWLDAPTGVGVERLRTTRGPLSFLARRTGRTVSFDVTGDVRVPAGGLVVVPPARGAASATVDGRAARLDSAGVTVRSLPARVVFTY